MDLAGELGGDVTFEGLSDSDADRLARLVAEAKKRQARALDAAVDRGLHNIPRLLRGSVKAVLFRR